MYLVLKLLLLLLILHWICSSTVDVKVDTGTVLNEIDERFVGVTLDAFLLQEGLDGLNLSNHRVMTLAKALAPSYLRIGGTAGDALTFDPSAPSIKPSEHRPPYTSNFTMNAAAWDQLNVFTQEVGWDLIFGLNAAIRNVTIWDPSNALRLLQYTAEKQYHVFAFELGNEPDLFWYQFGKLVTARQLVCDFNKLRSILKSMPFFNSTYIIGPDVSSNGNYFREFLTENGSAAIDVATYHHYYFDSHFARLEQFTDPNTLDQLIHNVQSAVSLGHQVGKSLWLGETSSASSQGKAGMSDTYVAGFMWLDKLGVAAKYGLKGVIRQDFYGGRYGLVQVNTSLPNPDYWLTLLFKRLVGDKVLNVTTTADHTVRVYGYCAKQNTSYNYGPGSVSITAINMKTYEVELFFSQYVGKRLDVYWLTPQNNDITSRRPSTLCSRNLDSSVNSIVSPLNQNPNADENVVVSTLAVLLDVCDDAKRSDVSDNILRRQGTDLAVIVFHGNDYGGVFSKSNNLTYATLPTDGL